MQLIPRRPPGPIPRKASAFGDEIRRLRALGYTAEAIREALADAGVHVGNSTVQRYAKRRSVAVVGSATEPIAPIESGTRSLDAGMPWIAGPDQPIQGDCS